MEGTLKIIPLSGAEHLPLDQLAQCPIQPSPAPGTGQPQPLCSSVGSLLPSGFSPPALSPGLPSADSQPRGDPFSLPPSLPLTGLVQAPSALRLRRGSASPQGLHPPAPGGSMARHGTAQHGTVRHSMARSGPASAGLRAAPAAAPLAHLERLQPHEARLALLVLKDEERPPILVKRQSPHGRHGCTACSDRRRPRAPPGSRRARRATTHRPAPAQQPQPSLISRAGPLWRPQRSLLEGARRRGRSASRGRGGEEGACTEQSGIRAAGEAAAGSAGWCEGGGGRTDTRWKKCARRFSPERLRKGFSPPPLHSEVVRPCPINDAGRA